VFRVAKAWREWNEGATERPPDGGDPDDELA
jgi:hypothetical protein